MPRKSPKLKILGAHIADARRIIDAQQALLEILSSAMRSAAAAETSANA
jgi:hypothetical protein